MHFTVRGVVGRGFRYGTCGMVLAGASAIAFGLCMGTGTGDAVTTAALLEAETSAETSELKFLPRKAPSFFFWMGKFILTRGA